MVFGSSMPLTQTQLEGEWRNYCTSHWISQEFYTFNMWYADYLLRQQGNGSMPNYFIAKKAESDAQAVLAQQRALDAEKARLEAEANAQYEPEPFKWLMAEFIKDCYRKLLKREPRTDEVSGWLDPFMALPDDQRNTQTLIDAFKDTPEYKNIGQDVPFAWSFTQEQYDNAVLQMQEGYKMWAQRVVDNAQVQIKAGATAQQIGYVEELTKISESCNSTYEGMNTIVTMQAQINEALSKMYSVLEQIQQPKPVVWGGVLGDVANKMREFGSYLNEHAEFITGLMVVASAVGTVSIIGEFLPASGAVGGAGATEAVGATETVVEAGGAVTASGGAVAGGGGGAFTLMELLEGGEEKASQVQRVTEQINTLDQLLNPTPTTPTAPDVPEPQQPPAQPVNVPIAGVSPAFLVGVAGILVVGVVLWFYNS